jgi:CBS-domain-containing membrane protein
MFARDIMTRDVVSVAPSTPVAEVARQLIAHRISAVPVVDHEGAVIGMVSEGDLIRTNSKSGSPPDETAAERRDWWLSILAEGEPLAREFLDLIHADIRCAGDIMTSPVVTVAPSTEASEIARLLGAYSIKRVPVLQGKTLIGIVSRADVLRAFAAPTASAAKSTGILKSYLADAVSRLAHHDQPQGQEAAPTQANTQLSALSAVDFKDLMADHAHEDAAERLATREKLAAQRREQVQTMIDTHIDDARWQEIILEAREAAMHGDKQHMLLRFPCDLCSDGGRAINVGEESWANTLSGEPAEIYLRFQRDLLPGGFSLKAQTIDFPGGFPGDIGLFLGWA